MTGKNRTNQVRYALRSPGSARRIHRLSHRLDLRSSPSKQIGSLTEYTQASSLSDQATETASIDVQYQASSVGQIFHKDQSISPWPIHWLDHMQGFFSAPVFLLKKGCESKAVARSTSSSIGQSFLCFLFAISGAFYRPIRRFSYTTHGYKQKSCLDYFACILAFWRESILGLLGSKLASLQSVLLLFAATRSPLITFRSVA